MTSIVVEKKYHSRYSTKNIFVLTLAASLFVHLVYIFFVNVNMPGRLIQPESKPLKIKVISQSKAKRRQVVETNQKENKKNLDKARDVFLGKNNSAVDKSTVAKKIGKFNNDGGTANIRSAKKSQSPSKHIKKTFSLSDLSFNKNLIKPLENIKNSKPSKAGASGDLLQSASNDHIKNIPLGDITQLNTTKFKFYGFYHRIKQKLEQHWGNSLMQKAKEIFKSGKKIKGNGDKLTALLVILDKKGNILQVRLKSTSGVDELDEAAVESFNKAGPFPNPPKEMLKAGKALIEWGFVVKT
jgi:TonB family protein